MQYSKKEYLLLKKELRELVKLINSQDLTDAEMQNKKTRIEELKALIIDLQILRQKEYNASYYGKHKDQRKDARVLGLTTTTCICGKTVLEESMTKHYKSKHHRKYALLNETIEEVNND